MNNLPSARNTDVVVLHRVHVKIDTVHCLVPTIGEIISANSLESENGTFGSIP